MNRLKFLYVFFFLVMISCIKEDAGNIVLKSENKFFKVKQIHFYKSPKNLHFEELIKLTEENQFRELGAEHFSFGITHDFVSMYFDLERRDESEWILELPSATLLTIKVYQIQEDNRIYSQESGISYLAHEKYSEHPFYQFPIINKSRKVRIYLQVNSDEPLTTPIYIWNKKTLNQIDGYRHLAFGLFFGIILSLALYNLLLFTTIQDRTYLYYVCYILSFGMFFFFVYGYAGYLYRDFLVRFQTKFIPFFAILTSVFASLFSRRFLNVFLFSPVLNKWFQFVILLGIISACFYFVIPHDLGVLIANLHPLIAAGLIVVSSITAIKNNYKPAIYFIIAWAGLLISVVCYIGSNLTILPSNFYMHYLQIPGAAFEAILLSLALGYRINDLRTREEETRKAALEKEIASRLQQERLSISFQRFVPEEFLKNLNKESILDIRQGDSVSCRMSVLFTDIRGFTNMSEKTQPEKVFSFLNQYLEKMEPIIKKYDGFIDKFIGDAIMALFPDEKKSILAAMEMLELSSQFKLPDNSSLEIGIGIHTGDLILGTIGSPSRIDTTVIGDTVNLASRIESLNKQYGTKLLVSEEVIRAINPNEIPIREIDLVRVKGKAIPILLYEIITG